MTNSATVSLWNATAAPSPVRPFAAVPPAHDPVDVLVVGAGVVGLTTALLLARAGRSVLVLEARGVGTGVSGSSAGKVTAAHGLRYAALRRSVGGDGARVYADANQAAVGWIRDLVRTERIACDWRDRAAFTYTSDPARVHDLQCEAEATIAAGLPAVRLHGPVTPTPALAGVRVDGGGELHGRNYCLGLAVAAESAGAAIAESVRVTGVHEGDPCRVRTEADGDVAARHVVVATHVPILDRGLFFARLALRRSYAIAARVDAKVPPGSFYDVGPPVRSVRTAVGPDGEPLVVVGGEGHPTGGVTDTAARYFRLETWAREHLDAREITHRWSSQDPATPDRVPYVGPLRPGRGTVWTATGFDMWGLSGGTAAAHAIAGRIAEGDDRWSALTDPARPQQFRPSGLLELVRWNLEAGVSLVGDRLRPVLGDADRLEPGDGAVLKLRGRRTALFRDGNGTLHAYAPACSHLGCEVRFNDAEQSWDCPCHGSRFDARTGRVLEGPAVRPLTLREPG